MKKINIAILLCVSHFMAQSQVFSTPPDYPIATLGSPSNIVKIEYFFDSDPGLGNGYTLDLQGNNSNNLVALSSAIVFPAGFTNQIHTLYVRVLDASGNWSITNIAKIDYSIQTPYPVASGATFPNINSFEYFFDTDPGLGKAATISLPSNTTDVNSMNATINFPTGFTNQVHTLYVRSRDANGKWSITNVAKLDNSIQTPYATAPANAYPITDVEYFVDTDPGLGKAKALNVSIPYDSIKFVDSIVQFNSKLSVGTHNLFIRSKQYDKWSITNRKSFIVYESPYQLSPATLNFGNVAIGADKTDSLVIKNISLFSQTLNSISLPSGFTTTTSFPITLAAQAEVKLYIKFSPPQQLFYSSTATLSATSSGTETILLQGKGDAGNPSMIISNSYLYDYGNVLKNASLSYNFTVTNTGNIPITISSTSITGTGAAAFSANVVGNSVIPIGGSGTVNVTFSPTANLNYLANVTINGSSPSGSTSVTAQVVGDGFTAGTPPTLEYLSTDPYNGTNGVSPEAANKGTFVYKVLYKSSTGLAPAPEYPKVGIDLNGDGDFLDAGEGVYSLTKEGTGSDYVNGVVYAYTTTYNNYSNTLGYQFFARDENNNSATASAVSYKSGPSVTDQLKDLAIYASDITFSNSKPKKGDAFTVTAVIRNNGPFTMTNVPIKFYNDSIYLFSGSISQIAPFSQSTISRTLTVDNDAYYPIKVWIDSARTLGESNVLNNYAIRAVTVGNFKLSGGINVSTNGFVSKDGVCVNGIRTYGITIRDTAKYFGIAPGLSKLVAGAEVTLVYNGTVYKTTTNVFGAYEVFIDLGTTCGIKCNYKVVVEDFTLTSDSTNGSVTVNCNTLPCPTLPKSTESAGSGVSIVVETTCQQPILGQDFTVNVRYCYRLRNGLYPGSSNDYIIKDVIDVKLDSIPVQRNFGGVIQTSPFHEYLRYSNNASAPGGNTSYFTTSLLDQRPSTCRSIPVTINTNLPGSHKISFKHTYTYKEFRWRLFQSPQDPTHRYLWGEDSTKTYPFWADTYQLDNGDMTYDMVDSATIDSIKLVPGIPNLTIRDFTQTSCTAFSVNDVNNSCIDITTPHHVKIYDNWNNTGFVLIMDVTVNSLSAGSKFSITGSVSALKFGHHIIRVVTDANSQITETDETDNQFDFVISVCKPDFVIDSIRASTSSINNGSVVNFTAYVRNQGAASPPAQLSFFKDGVAFSTQNLPALAKYGVTSIVSSTVAIGVNDNGCGFKVTAFADSSYSVPEENKINNKDSLFFGPDPSPIQLVGEPGSTSALAFEVLINLNASIPINIRNLGARDVSNVEVQYALKSTGTVLGTNVAPLVKAGVGNPAVLKLNTVFTTLGLVELRVVTDPNIKICQPNRNNDTASFWVKVVEGKPDFEILSQYISPSNLNPNAGQSITIVGTVKNVGTKVSEPNNVRFYVDDVQLGGLVNINALKPGRDTTVSATIPYTATPSGIRIMKMAVDEANSEIELREDNNVATRALVVGPAPDFARAQLESLSFSNSSFIVGSSTNIGYYVRNYGALSGSGSAKFYLSDLLGNRTLIATQVITIAAYDSVKLIVPWTVTTNSGRIIAVIEGVSPQEFNLFNNTDSVDFTQLHVWTGNTNSKWNIATNWSKNILPPSSAIVTIPSGIANQPSLDSNITVSGIYLNGTLDLNSNKFTINGTIKGSGKIKGSVTSSLVVNSTTNDTLYFGSGKDSLLASLTQSGSGTTVIGSGLGITGTLSVQGGALFTNNKLTLKSISIANSAIVGKVSGSVVGKVTVERFIPQGYRAYRDLGAQVTNAGSMYNNWQECGNNTNGYGIFITGSLGTSSGVDPITGFDYTATGYGSIYTDSVGVWSADNTGFSNFASTKNYYLNPYAGYRVLVRGNRAFSLFAPQPTAMVSDAIIRATGNLVTGMVTYSTSGVSGLFNSGYRLTSGVNAFSFIANPYVAPIDWVSIYSNATNITSSYWYLDPTFQSGGYSTYVTYNAVSQTNSNPTYSNVGRYIQPGQAFFIQNDNTTNNPQLIIQETDKSINTALTSVFGGNNKVVNRISISLFRDNKCVDGAVAVFDNTFNKSYGKEDSRKLSNAADNLSIVEGTNDLSIDGLANPTISDVVNLKLANVASNTAYNLKLNVDEFNGNGVQAYLNDSYNNTQTLLSGTTNVAFTPTSAAATYSNRFSIIFKKTSPLFISSIHVKAQQKAEDVLVNWTVTEETKVTAYEVQTSSNGKEFTTATSVKANNSGSTSNYSWSDTKASTTTGTHYYRIKTIGMNGEVSYSQLVEVVINSSKGQITIYPNPVKGSTIGLELTNLNKATYTAVLYNNLGQQIISKTIQHNGGSATVTIDLGKKLSAGIYSLKVASNNGTSLEKEVIAE